MVPLSPQSRVGCWAGSDGRRKVFLNFDRSPRILMDCCVSHFEDGARVIKEYDVNTYNIQVAKLMLDFVKVRYFEWLPILFVEFGTEFVRGPTARTIPG